MHGGFFVSGIMQQGKRGPSEVFEALDGVGIFLEGHVR